MLGGPTLRHKNRPNPALAVLHRGFGWRIVRPIGSVSERNRMQRNRAKAIAMAQQQVLVTRLTVAAGMLLLPALLLLLISP